jgi:iron(III) transport system ATP-binding protein
VLDVRFLGDVALVEMAVQGLDEPLLARLRENDAPALGAEIGVGIDPAAILVFEAENGAQSGAA